MTKEEIKRELDRLIEIRNDFYNYLDENIPKDEKGVYKLDGVKLDAKDVYNNFFKLDYQARKLRAILVQSYDLKAE